jgi:TolA-binding protein
MRREHRRELQHDRFVDEVGSLWSKAGENQRLLIVIGVVVVAVVLGVYGFYFYRNTRERDAQKAFTAAAEVIDSPLLPPAGGQAQPGAKYKTEPERNAAAQSQFQQVETKFSGTDAADVAKLYLARLDAGRGDVNDARKLLEQFIGDHPKHVLVGSARFSLFQLRIENGEASKVASELQAEITKPDPILPADTLLVLLAHAYDAQGNGNKSRDTYRRIVTEFPDSPYAVEAQRRVGPA